MVQHREFLIHRIINTILATGFITTIAVSPSWNYDPINLIKALIVTLGTFFAVGIVLANRGHFNFKSKKLFPIYFFGFSIVIPLFLAPAPFSQQFWGIFGRNTGALTLLVSSLIILISSLVIDATGLVKMIRILIALNVFLVFYCLVQIAGLDPVGWSQFAPFATLGNVNFLSAILGMLSVILFVHLFYSEELLSLKLILVAVLIVNIFVMLKTDSIQGPIIFIIGGSFSALCFAWLRKERLTMAILSLLLLPMYAGGIFGLFNQGPLSKFVYQASNVFRADYMSAAWKTFLANFATGVGHDSFDGWYRTERGFISAYRTNPLRTTNSAHNIYLDMAANGGIFLFISYLSLVVVTLVSALNYLRKCKVLDVAYMSILGAWVAFIVQSAISINQIGVSIWGWIFTGAILGISSGKTDNLFASKSIFGNRNLHKTAKKKRNSSFLSAKSITFSIMFGIIGLLVSLPPLIADSRYKTAMNNRNLNELLQVAELPGTTAFHLGTIIDLARRNNFEPQAIELSEKLTSRFPRDFFGWNVRMTFASLPNEIRKQAYTRAKELDPYFYCADINPSQNFLDEFDRLPVSKKYELVRWWGMVPFSDSRVPENISWLKTLTTRIAQKASTFCAS